MVGTHLLAAVLASAAAPVSTGPTGDAAGSEAPRERLPDLGTMGWFALTVGCQAVILAVGHGVLRWRHAADARAPADERDRAISRRSLGAAYYVLIAGVILVGCVMPFQSAGWRLINAAVAAIVLAEVVRYGVAAYCYRRGFHG